MDTTTVIRVVAGVVAIFICVPIFVIPYWKIFSKAGFTGALALLMIVPLINLVVLYVVAFSEWRIKPGKTPAISEIDLKG